MVEVASPVMIDILGSASVVFGVRTTCTYVVGVALSPPAEHPTSPR